MWPVRRLGRAGVPWPGLVRIRRPAGRRPWIGDPATRWFGGQVSRRWRFGCQVSRRWRLGGEVSRRRRFGCRVSRWLRRSGWIPGWLRGRGGAARWVGRSGTPGVWRWGAGPLLRIGGDDGQLFGGVVRRLGAGLCRDALTAVPVSRLVRPGLVRVGRVAPVARVVGRLRHPVSPARTRPRDRGRHGARDGGPLPGERSGHHGANDSESWLTADRRCEAICGQRATGRYKAAGTLRIPAADVLYVATCYVGGLKSQIFQPDSLTSSNVQVPLLS